VVAVMLIVVALGRCIKTGVVTALPVVSIILTVLMAKAVTTVSAKVVHHRLVTNVGQLVMIIISVLESFNIIVVTMPVGTMM
jgi:hypothetical protein